MQVFLQAPGCPPKLLQLSTPSSTTTVAMVVQHIPSLFPALVDGVDSWRERLVLTFEGTPFPNNSQHLQNP
eukprot:m.2263 g.2263  ORF g.2263 m.2263 type:complete len:71 (+) comp2559_c0_seq1:110-322(+)